MIATLADMWSLCPEIAIMVGIGVIGLLALVVTLARVALTPCECGCVQARAAAHAYERTLPTAPWKRL